MVRRMKMHFCGHVHGGNDGLTSGPAYSTSFPLCWLIDSMAFFTESWLKALTRGEILCVMCRLEALMLSSANTCHESN